MDEKDKRIAELEARLGGGVVAQPASAPVSYMQPQPVAAPMGYMAHQPAHYAPGGMPQSTGVSMPVRLNTPQGEVSAFFHFGPDCLDPNALQGLMMQLANMGLLKVYTPRNNGGGGYGGGGGGYRGGGGGGYGGGGYRGGGRW